MNLLQSSSCCGGDHIVEVTTKSKQMESRNPNSCANLGIISHGLSLVCHKMTWRASSSTNRDDGVVQEMWRQLVTKAEGILESKRMRGLCR